MLSDSQRAAFAARLRRGRRPGAVGIPRRPAELTTPPMSYGQEQLWFIDRFAPGLPTYNIPVAVRLTGPLDTAALERALAALVARQEALRTRLVSDEDGRPVQRIDDPAPVTLDRADLSGLAPEPRRRRLRDLLHEESLRPFALAAGPLLRATLIRLERDRHVLLVVVHHAVFDGWSTGVLVTELAALYGAEAAGEPSGLAELPIQFADYAVWERDRLSGDTLSDLEEYWRRTLDGAETLNVPTDRPRPPVDSFDGALAEHTLPLPVLEGLRELAREHGTTPFVLVLAAVQALLTRYTGQTDVVVGTVSANRGRGELASVIGFLVNTLPVRTDLSGDPTFAELVDRVKDATVGAYAHQDLPFGRLVESLRVERDPSRAPVFQVAVVQGERNHAPVHAGGVAFTLTDLIVGINAAKFDLGLAVEARDTGLWLECCYKTALFDEATIRRLLGHLDVLLRGALADPSRRLSALPLLTDAERHRELVEWNDTAAPVPDTCVHQEIERQVRSTPDAVAAECAGHRVRYADLNARANRLARRLRAAGVGPSSLVGVCLPAGPDRLAVLLAAWKAGGGYVPLDPALPADRLSYLIADTGMAVIVTDDAGLPRLPATRVPIVSLDADRAALDALDPTDLGDVGVTPSDIAYVLYTSGSTGEPKGVVLEHRNVVNFVLGMAAELHTGPDDVVLQFASLSFDVSVMDMFVPLVSGGRVLLADTETLHSPPRLAALMRDAGVTVACLPPAVVSLLADERFPALRALMAAGEALPAELVPRWIRPGLTFLNGYGPTEATVIAAHAVLGPADADGVTPPPIGLPTRPNYGLYVLDAHLNPVPAGVVGELHIGGAGVARGYLNKPGLTAERFVDNPFAAGTLYRTGDLVRRRPDGRIVFVGRVDGQVKIRGLRVELGEIEAVLAGHSGVAQAVVVLRRDRAGEQHLVGYVRPTPGHTPDAAELRAHAATKLPTYMVPSHLLTLDAFPVNTSGKIDRSALPAPDTDAAAGDEAPATLLEVMLADMFATLLDRDQIGVTDSFFDRGGTSLQAMRLINMVDAELAVGIGVSTVFLAPSVRQLAAVLRDEHGLDDADLDAESLDELSEVG